MKSKTKILTPLLLLVVIGCGSNNTVPLTISLTSPAFPSGATIPKKYSGEGEDVSPALQWSNIPKEAKELALICDDPDAPLAEPWVHWVLYKLSAAETGLPEGLAGDVKCVQGKNDFGKSAYGGPMPPPGHGTHHYHFKLYALNAPLDLPPGASKKELLAAMNGKIIAQGELLGTYERQK